MAFETKKIYRSLNGEEVKTIISQRVLAAMKEDSTVNIARAFPLLEYQVTVKLTPYHQAGKEVKPDPSICYEVDGMVFIPSNTEPAAVELVENSPLYGRDADPQELRKLAEQGVVETARTNTGEMVDVRVKAGEKPALAPSQITEPQSWPDGKAPGQAPAAAPDEDPETTYKVEEGRWASSHADDAIEKAIAERDPNAAPGRVSIVQTGKAPQRGRPGR